MDFFLEIVYVLVSPILRFTILFFGLKVIKIFHIITFKAQGRPWWVSLSVKVWKLIEYLKTD